MVKGAHLAWDKSDTRHLSVVAQATQTTDKSSMKNRVYLNFRPLQNKKKQKQGCLFKNAKAREYCSIYCKYPAAFSHLYDDSFIIHIAVSAHETRKCIQFNREK